MASQSTGFDVLLSKSVPHILEKIFFSLDCESFVVCREVCSTWKELLASDKYQKKYNEMLVEKADTEKKLLDASTNGSAEDVNHLLTYGVDPNCQQSSGDNMACKSAPLHLAILNGHIDVVKILLDEGADPNKKYVRKYYERTPLMLATLRNNSKVIELLFEAGADPNIETKGEPWTWPWTTPLHVAVTFCNKDAVKALLDRGADPHIVNIEGQSPLNLVLGNVFQPGMANYNVRKLCNRQKNNRELPEVVRLLLDAGAEPHEDYWENKKYLELFGQM